MLTAPPGRSNSTLPSLPQVRFSYLDAVQLPNANSTSYYFLSASSLVHSGTACHPPYFFLHLTRARVRHLFSLNQTIISLNYSCTLVRWMICDLFFVYFFALFPNWKKAPHFLFHEHRSASPSIWQAPPLDSLHIIPLSFHARSLHLPFLKLPHLRFFCESPRHPPLPVTLAGGAERRGARRWRCWRNHIMATCPDDSYTYQYH